MSSAITTSELRNMHFDTFSMMYSHTRINEEVEIIFGLVLKEQCIKHNSIMEYPLDGLPILYHTAIRVGVRNRIQNASVYTDARKNVLVVDWSL